MNKLIHEELLSETYPSYKDAGYEMQWINSNRVGITWNYGKTRYTEYNAVDLAESLEQDMETTKALSRFIYSIHPLDAVEAADYGNLGFSSRSGLWEVSSLRADGSVATAFMDSFTPQERTKIRKSWTSQFRSSHYTVSQNNLLIEIGSKDSTVSPSHCLHSMDSLKILLADYYDVSDTTEILLSASPQGSLLIGHKDAVERLCEIPGNEYIRKTCKLIEEELWSDYVA